MPTEPVNYEDLTLEELKDLAQEADIKGRSGMNKSELAHALEVHRINQFDPSAARAFSEATDPESPGTEPAEEDGTTDFSPPPDPASDYVAREQYDAVVAENQQLRAQMQYQLQGAVGARYRNSPDPGV